MIQYIICWRVFCLSLNRPIVNKCRVSSLNNDGGFFSFNWLLKILYSPRGRICGRRPGILNESVTHTSSGSAARRRNRQMAVKLPQIGSDRIGSASLRDGRETKSEIKPKAGRRKRHRIRNRDAAEQPSASVSAAPRNTITAIDCWSWSWISFDDPLLSTQTKPQSLLKDRTNYSDQYLQYSNNVIAPNDQLNINQ